MGAAVRILGAKQAIWAQAMQAEVSAIESEREAFGFAWGCLLTALGHALVETRHVLAQVQNVGVVTCSGAVLFGCLFMVSAGAPGHYVVMNLVSLALAVATFRLLPRRRLQVDELLRARLSFAMGALLLIASLGQTAIVATPWLRAWTVPVNLTWLLLPALLVAADVKSRTSAQPWAHGGLLMAFGALALQADAVLATLAAAVLIVRAWHHRSRSLGLHALAASAIAMHLSQGWQAPEPSRFVDLVLQSGFEQNLAIGLCLALLQLLPLWPALRHPQARGHGLVWGVLVALSLPGWLPSPLVGFGGSFIVAYLLSLAMVGDGTAAQPAAGPGRAVARRRWDPPALPRTGQT